MDEQDKLGADPMIKITHTVEEDDHDLLKSMLGAFELHDPKHWGWKNKLESHEDNVQRLDNLVTRGLVIKGKPCANGHWYHATRRACEFLGMAEIRIEVALELRHRI